MTLKADITSGNLEADEPQADSSELDSGRSLILKAAEKRREEQVVDVVEKYPTTDTLPTGRILPARQILKLKCYICFVRV